MNFLETEPFEPVAAWCNETHLSARLRNGAVIRVPVWWYPRLQAGTLVERNMIELSPLGLHWEVLDEDIKIEGMILGRKAPGAVPPMLDAAE